MKVIEEEMVNLALKLQEYVECMKKCEFYASELERYEEKAGKLEMDLGLELLAAIRDKAEYRIRAAEHGEKAND